MLRRDAEKLCLAVRFKRENSKQKNAMLVGHKKHVSLTSQSSFTNSAKDVHPEAVERERPVPQMIFAQTMRTPDRTALVTESERLTYTELSERASRLANHLKSLGAGPEVVIGLCIERSPQFVVAALAVMQSGAAYLPMEPDHPAERLRYLITDAGARLVITQSNLAALFTGLDIKVIVPERERTAIEQQSSEPPVIEQELDHLAYVIYTSGSTGQPKGVEITHRNLTNLVSWHIRAFAVDSSTRGTFQAGVGFDAAVWEIWPLLTIGASLYLPDESIRFSAESLRDWLLEQEITISFVPTIMAEELMSLPWPNEVALRFLLTGADTLHHYPPTGLPFSLVNNYGPTECTVVTTSGVIRADANQPGLPPIGFPIDNVRISILDAQLQEVADGAPGEIFVGGKGVGRGYRNHPNLTAERFIPDPFGVEGGRLYRTGDLGRKLPNGQIGFLGRLDDQVKIRGYRVELNEISALLKEHPSVKANIVIAREDIPGDKRLIAYVVPTEESQQNEEALRNLIRQRLPDYMEPASFVWMKSLPLTPNGKVDRAALPNPNMANRLLVHPRTPVEQALASIIKDVLKLADISINDDFFQLGAHSLLGAQIVARVRSAFGAELKLLDVFDAPTVAELSAKIELALTQQLAAMTEAEVGAALATLNGVTARGSASQ